MLKNSFLNIVKRTYADYELGKDISMKTINDLCHILKCQIEDICKYTSSDND